MKRVLFLAFAAIMVAVSANAIPAMKQFTVTQPDGTTITVNGYGDEWYGYFTTTDGYKISRGSDGYYYYLNQATDGRLFLSKTIAHNPNNRSSAEMTAIRGLNKQMTNYAAIQQAQIKRREAGIERQETLEQRRQAQNSPDTRVALGEDRVLVILANFTDVKWSSANAANATNVFNQKDYNGPGQTYNGNGSVKDYYEDNAMGKYTVNFDVFGPVELPQNRKYYGENVNNEPGADIRASQMIRDACAAANSIVNFAEYAINGTVQPTVVVLYAGMGEADGGPAESIWPHQSSISGTYDGVSVRKYYTSPELNGHSGLLTSIGVICHEFGHVLGLPDWYDTDYGDNGQGYGLGPFSLMGSGSYLFEATTPPALHIVERWMLGWVDEIPEITESGNYSLAPVYDTHTGYKIATKTTNEYFMIENRNGTLSKWDRIFRENDNNGRVSGASPGKGMLVYQYDRSNNRVGGGYTAGQLWNYNAINAFADHECFRLLMAQPIPGSSNIGKVFFPGAGNVTSFVMNGWTSGYAGGVSNIAFSGNNITFSITLPDENNDPAIRDIVITPNQLDMTVTWQGANTGTWKVQWRVPGSTSYAEQTVTNKIANLPKLRSNATYEIVITDVGAGASGSATGTTIRPDAQKMPSLNGMTGRYTVNDPVILSAINLQNSPRSIEWSINGTVTTSTCHFLTAGVYTIEAKITNSDNSVEYLKRKINVTNQ